MRGLVRPVGDVRGLLPGLIEGDMVGDIIGDVVGDGEAVISDPVPGVAVLVVAEGDGEDIELPVVPFRLVSSPQAPSSKASPKILVPKINRFFMTPFS
ncbi:MAG: hypothetical protein U0Y68_05180 [Blastocatellia bacterium]